MNYGIRLKQLRKANKLSIYRLSKDSKISPGHISDIEKSKNMPNIKTLKRLLTPMGITLSEFFNEGGEISILNETEKALVSQFRTLPDDKADLALKMIKALNR